MRSVSEKNRGGSIAVSEIMWKNVVERDRQQMTI
jgi:hypothetical protein